AGRSASLARASRVGHLRPRKSQIAYRATRGSSHHQVKDGARVSQKPTPPPYVQSLNPKMIFVSSVPLWCNPASAPLNSLLARFVRSDPDRLFDHVDENFAVADLPGFGCLDHGSSSVFHHAVGKNHFDFDFRQKVDGILAASINFRMAFLPTEAFDLGNR